MKKIKHYSIRRNHVKNILNKTLIASFLSIFSIFFVNIIWFNYLSTNILWKINNKELFEKAEQLSFNWTTWPVKEIADLSYMWIKNSNMTYSSIRDKQWHQIPDSMRTTFPVKMNSYMNKYKNITLSNAWNVFSDPSELNEFTFKRRILRATWTADYSSANIWKKNTWTHAWIDIIANVWTPSYSIANGLVIKKEKSNTWFGNYIAILHKIQWDYFLSFYWHMYSLENNIKVWDFIQKGDRVWTIWNSWNSYGSHLHFQINKVFTLQDIVNDKVMMWWYHNLDGVKAYTVDPINLIENNYTSVWDDLVYDDKDSNKDETLSNENNISDKWIASPSNEEDEINKNIKETNENDVDLVTAISKELEKETEDNSTKSQHSSAPEQKAYIKNIDLNLMSDKIQLWHSFDVNLSVSTWDGVISIIPSNENLKFNKDKIENPNNKNYKIQFIAKHIWETKLTFSDGKQSKTYNVRIYKKETESIYWIKIDVNDLNLIEESKITIYPTNKFWQTIDSNLKWNFKIYFEKNNKKEFVKNILINDKKYIGYIKWNILWKWKLIIESDKFYSKNNISVDISKDYSYNNNYSNSMYELIKNWIVNWDNWKLYPNRKLTRRELLTILWRSVLNSDYDNIKNQMHKYIDNNGKFFNDIDGSAYSDPYVYISWKKNIIKWENNNSLANTYVSKWELLTIFTRIFDIKAQNDTLNTWNDLQSNTQLKKIADTSKKYWLYPFEQFEQFNSWKKISRVIAFETLQRFINYTKEDDSYISSMTEKENLEKELKNILEF